MIAVIPAAGLPHVSHPPSPPLFLGWCRREGEIDQLRAQVPTLPRRVPDVLSRQDIDRLEELARLERDKVILRLLADTGIRAGELVGLGCDDLVERRRHRFYPYTRKGRQGPAGTGSTKPYRRFQRLTSGLPDDAFGAVVFVARRRRPGGRRESVTVRVPAASVVLKCPYFRQPLW
jgi:integrase